MQTYFIHSFTGNQNRAYGQQETGAPFKVHYRGVICQVADFLGYVPLLGTVVGVARIAASSFVAIGCLFAVGGIMLASSLQADDVKEDFYEKGIQKTYVLIQRSKDECFRGLNEIIPRAMHRLEENYRNNFKDTKHNYHVPTGPVYYVDEYGHVAYPWIEFNRFNERFDKDQKQAFGIKPRQLANDPF